MTALVDTAPAAKATAPAPMDFAMKEFLDDPPSVVVYGLPGVGKSTDIFLAFPNALFLLSARGVLRPAASYLRDNPSCGLHMPLPLIDEDGRVTKIEFDTAKNVTRYWSSADAAANKKEPTFEIPAIVRGAYVVIPEFAATESGLTRVNNWALIKTYAQAFITRSKNEPKRYDALVLDEMSAFSTRVFEDIKTDKNFLAASGKPDTFRAQNELHQFHRYLGKTVPLLSKKALIMACHSAEPKYFDDEGDPRHGKLKYHGGPRFPIGSLIETVTADMDVVLQLKVESSLGTVERMYATEADPLYVRKFRDFGIKPKEKIGLRGLLTRAAYTL